MKKSGTRNGNMLDNIQKSIGTEKVTASSPGKMKKGGMVSKKKPLPKAFLGAIGMGASLLGANMLGKKLQKKVKSDIKEVGPMLGMAAGLPPGVGAAAGAAGGAGGAGGLGSMLGGIPGMKKGGVVKKAKKK